MNCARRGGGGDDDATAADNAAQIIIAKNRDGQTGGVGLYWNKELSMFGNAAQVEL